MESHYYYYYYYRNSTIVTYMYVLCDIFVIISSTWVLPFYEK